MRTWYAAAGHQLSGSAANTSEPERRTKSIGIRPRRITWRCHPRLTGSGYQRITSRITGSRYCRFAGGHRRRAEPIAGRGSAHHRTLPR